MFGMKTRQATDRTRDTAAYDDVTLADGTTVAVARGNLVAAKALLAAQKAAERRVAEARQQRESVAVPAPAYTTTAAPGSAQRHPQPALREQSRYRVAAAGAPAPDGHSSASHASASAQAFERAK